MTECKKVFASVSGFFHVQDRLMGSCRWRPAASPLPTGRGSWCRKNFRELSRPAQPHAHPCGGRPCPGRTGCEVPRGRGQTRQMWARGRDRRVPTSRDPCHGPQAPWSPTGDGQHRPTWVCHGLGVHVTVGPQTHKHRDRIKDSTPCGTLTGCALQSGAVPCSGVPGPRTQYTDANASCWAEGQVVDGPPGAVRSLPNGRGRVPSRPGPRAGRAWGLQRPVLRDLRRVSAGPGGALRGGAGAPGSPHVPGRCSPGLSWGGGGRNAGPRGRRRTAGKVRGRAREEDGGPGTEGASGGRGAPAQGPRMCSGRTSSSSPA